MLGRRRQTAFGVVLLAAGAGARAVDSHLAAGLFGGQRVPLPAAATAGRAGTVGALQAGGGEVVGGGAGLRGRPGGRGRRRAVHFVALGVALRRGAGVDAVRVALRRRLGRPPALPGGFDQVLQRDGAGLHTGVQSHQVRTGFSQRRLLQTCASL